MNLYIADTLFLKPSDCTAQQDESLHNLEVVLEIINYKNKFAKLVTIGNKTYGNETHLQRLLLLQLTFMTQRNYY